VSTQTPCPEAILAAIPWYPDGLTREERGDVEAHAADCRACRAELSFLLEEEEEEAAIEIPDSEAVYARLLERIAESDDGDLDAPASPAPEWLRRFSETARGPISMAAGLMIALVSGMLTSGVIWTVRVVPAYESASAAPPEVSTGGPYLQVVFDEGATAAEMNERLRAVRGSVVSGPTPRGVYQVRLAPGSDVEAALDLLRGEARGVIAFAEASGS